MARNVLLVDDNRELAENLAEILETEGFDAAVCDDPREALQLAEHADFDIAILDVRMPVMDGVTLYEKLRSLRPGTTYVLMTAFTSDQRIQDALAAGVRTILPKPIPIETLLEQLPPPADGHYVALVEDDAELADSLRELLRERGYAVHWFSTVSDTESSLTGTSLTGAVVDVRLPDGDGAELARTLCERWPELPVVLITGYDPEEAAAVIESTCSGRCRILTKPFKPESLLQTLRELGSQPPPART